MSPRTRSRPWWLTVLGALALGAAVVGPAAASTTIDSAQVSARAERVDPPTRRVTIIAGGDVLAETRVRNAAAAHVVQPFEMVGSTAVWWSLGNFVSQMGPPSTGRYADPRGSDGLLADVEFVQLADGRWTMTPTSIAICNDALDRTVRRPTVELSRHDLDPRVRSELSACLARTRELVPDAR